MLFPDLFNNHQLSFYDLDGTSTYSNVIKKVYISKSKIKPMKKNDILVFYTSQIKKSIACVCVVDDAFRANEERKNGKRYGRHAESFSSR